MNGCVTMLRVQVAVGLTCTTLVSASLSRYLKCSWIQLVELDVSTEWDLEWSSTRLCFVCNLTGIRPANSETKQDPKGKKKLPVGSVHSADVLTMCLFRWLNRTTQSGKHIFTNQSTSTNRNQESRNSSHQRLQQSHRARYHLDQKTNRFTLSQNFNLCSTAPFLKYVTGSWRFDHTQNWLCWG
jgi:hypothetical protein